MKKKFCEYCGTPLEDGCRCHAEVEQARLDFIEEYESRPDVQYGWRQQDLIDQHRYER